MVKRLLLSTLAGVVLASTLVYAQIPSPIVDGVWSVDDVSFGGSGTAGVLRLCGVNGDECLDLDIESSSNEAILSSNTTVEQLRFDSPGNARVRIDRGAASNGGEVQFQTAASIDWVAGVADSDTAGVAGDEFFIGTAAAGATFEMAIHNEGWFIYEEADASPTCTELDADDSVAIYNTNDTLVFAYCNGVTMTYVKLLLDGSDTTLAHDTTAP